MRQPSISIALAALRRCRFLWIAMVAFFAVSFADELVAQVHVSGYHRHDGTYVAPHHRSMPDGNFYNNWSTKGNRNPYTGEWGTKVTPPSAYAHSVSVAMMSSLSSGHSASAPSLDSLKKAAAIDLRLKGVPTDWRLHSLPELKDMNARKEYAIILRRLEVIVDWEEYSRAELKDMLLRKQRSIELSRMGIKVNWRDYTSEEMMILYRNRMSK